MSVFINNTISAFINVYDIQLIHTSCTNKEMHNKELISTSIYLWNSYFNNFYFYNSNIHNFSLCLYTFLETFIEA